MKHDLNPNTLVDIVYIITCKIKLLIMINKSVDMEVVLCSVFKSYFGNNCYHHDAI